jgi:hypothetical protein
MPMPPQHRHRQRFIAVGPVFINWQDGDGIIGAIGSWLLRYCICCIPHMRQMRYLMCCIDDLSQHTFCHLPPQGCSVHSVVSVRLAKEPWPQAQDPLNSAVSYTGQSPSCWTSYRHRVLVRCLHFVMRCIPLHLSHQSHAIAYLWHSMQ